MQATQDYCHKNIHDCTLDQHVLFSFQNPAEYNWGGPITRYKFYIAPMVAMETVTSDNQTADTTTSTERPLSTVTMPQDTSNITVVILSDGVISLALLPVQLDKSRSYLVTVSIGNSDGLSPRATTVIIPSWTQGEPSDLVNVTVVIPPPQQIKIWMGI